MRQATLTVLLAATLTTGCTQYWGKPGMTVTEAEWNRDIYECELQAAGIPRTPRTYAPNPGAPGWAGVQQSGAALQNASQGLFDRAASERLYAMCMTAKGYERVSAEGTPLGAAKSQPRAVAPAPTGTPEGTPR